MLMTVECHEIAEWAAYNTVAVLGQDWANSYLKCVDMKSSLVELMNRRGDLWRTGFETMIKTDKVS